MERKTGCLSKWTKRRESGAEMLRDFTWILTDLNIVSSQRGEGCVCIWDSGERAQTQHELGCHQIPTQVP